MLRTFFSGRGFPTKAPEHVSSTGEDEVCRMPFVSRTVFTDTLFELFVYDVRTLFPLVDNWSFNRSVRQHHVQSIYEDLKGMRTPHLLGSIKVVRNPDGDHRIIDGQHRLLAIRKILEEDETMLWNMDVIVELYHVDNIDCGNEVFDLYMKANRNMNVTNEDALDVAIIDIVHALSRDTILSAGIVDKQDGSVYRPRISKKDLYEQFKLHYKPAEHIPVDRVVVRVNEINRKLGLLSLRHLFGERCGDRAKVQRKKAEEYRFFLNMRDSKYPPPIWIPLIYDDTILHQNQGIY